MRTPLGRFTAVAASVTVAIALTSCGADEPDPGETLDTALAQLQEASSGSFQFALGASLHVSGTYDLDSESSRATLSTNDGEEQASVDQVSSADRTWVRVQERGDGSGCWVSTTGGGTPAYVEVALSAEATEWVEPGSVLRGTVDLGLLVATLGEASDDVQVDDATARVEALFLLEEGALTAWKTDMASVLSAVRDAGGELSADMEQVISTGDEVLMMASFSDTGAAVDHATPQTDNVVEVGGDDEDGIETAVASCVGD